MAEEKKKELKALVRLALPLAAAQAGMTLMGLVDVAVLGRLGAEELGASGLGNALFFAIAIVGVGIVMGVDPLVSQALGARDEVEARRVLWQGVWLSIAVGLFLMIPMILSPLVLQPMGIDASLVAPAALYTRIRALSLVPFLMFVAIRAYLQAHGITRPMIVAMVIGNVFNLFADLLFVFGGGGLPEWTGPLRSVPAYGVAGAALATVFGSVLQLAILAMAVRAIPAPAEASDLRRFDRRLFGSAFRVGLPVGLQMGAEVGVFALAGLFAGKFGAAPLAAHQISISLASFTFTCALGIGAAASVRVGRKVGALDTPGARSAGLVAFGAGGAFMAMSALLFWLFPRPLASLMTNQPLVLAAAVPLLAVAAVFQISDGIQGVGAGVLRGAGDTRFAFYANVVGHWLVGLPVALFLGFRLGYGVVGLWWGLCVGLTAVAALLYVRFLRISSREIRPLVRPFPMH